MARVIPKPFKHDDLIIEYNNILNAYGRRLSEEDVRDIVEIYLRFAIGAITQPHIYTDITQTINETLSLDVFIGVSINDLNRILQVTDEYLEQLVRILVSSGNDYNFHVTNIYSYFYMTALA